MDAPALQLFRGDDCKREPLPVRGVGWVLRWAATLAVLAVSAVILLTFVYQLAGERTLARAASAGLREAALPRATSRSVETVVRHHLAGRFDLHRATTIELQQNGSPVKGVVRPQSGDQLLLTLAAPARAALPAWLRALVPWQAHAAIATQIERRSTSSSRPARPFGL
jgi:hypothetical protein